MDREALFPDAWAEGRDERIRARWDLDYPLPMPRSMELLHCPVCSIGGGEGFFGRMVVKDWKFHKRTRTGSKAPWRCDVRMKCVDCSGVQIFGVAIGKAMWDNAFAHYCSANQWVSWRKGRQILAEAGYFD